MSPLRSPVRNGAESGGLRPDNVGDCKELEHSIDLSACHFIKGVAPLSAQKIMKKIKRTFEEADMKDTADLDVLDTHLAAFDFDNDNDLDDLDSDQESSEKVDPSLADLASEEVDIADSVGKALALMKQVFS
jgi:hypothetical protein